MSETRLNWLALRLHNAVEADDALAASAAAGQLARLDADHPALATVPSVALGSLDPALHQAAGHALFAVEGVTEETSLGEALAALDALDAACAAAWWLERSEVVSPAVGDACDGIAAWPEAWADLAPAASRKLEEEPPHSGDPALVLWRTVESAALGLAEEGPEAPGAPGPVRVAAGLDVVVSLSRFRDALRRAAASDLPEPGGWLSLRDAPDWSAGLGVEDGQLFLVVDSADAAVTVTHDGEPVPLVAAGAAQRCPVSAGDWSIAVGADVLDLQLTDGP